MKHIFPILVAVITVVILFALDKTACKCDPNYGWLAQLVTLVAITLNCALAMIHIATYART